MTMTAHVRVGLDNLQEHASTFESVPAPVAADWGATLHGSPVVAIEQRDAAVCSARFERWVAQVIHVPFKTFPFLGRTLSESAGRNH